MNALLQKPEARALVQRAVRKVGAEVAAEQLMRILSKVVAVHRATPLKSGPRSLQDTAMAALVRWAMAVVRDAARSAEAERQSRSVAATKNTTVVRPVHMRIDAAALLNAQPIFGDSSSEADDVHIGHQIGRAFDVHINRHGAVSFIPNGNGRDNAPAQQRRSALRVQDWPSASVAPSVSASSPVDPIRRRSPRRASPPRSSAGAAARGPQSVTKASRRQSPARSERERTRTKSPGARTASSFRSRSLALDILYRAELEEEQKVATDAAEVTAAEELLAEAERDVAAEEDKEEEEESLLEERNRLEREQVVPAKGGGSFPRWDFGEEEESRANPKSSQGALGGVFDEHFDDYFGDANDERDDVTTGDDDEDDDDDLPPKEAMMWPGTELKVSPTTKQYMHTAPRPRSPSPIPSPISPLSRHRVTPSPAIVAEMKRSSAERSPTPPGLSAFMRRNHAVGQLRPRSFGDTLAQTLDAEIASQAARPTAMAIAAAASRRADAALERELAQEEASTVAYSPRSESPSRSPVSDAMGGDNWMHGVISGDENRSPSRSRSPLAPSTSADEAEGQDWMNGVLSDESRPPSRATPGKGVDETNGDDDDDGADVPPPPPSTFSLLRRQAPRLSAQRHGDGGGDVPPPPPPLPANSPPPGLKEDAQQRRLAGQLSRRAKTDRAMALLAAAEMENSALEDSPIYDEGILSSLRRVVIPLSPAAVAAKGDVTAMVTLSDNAAEAEADGKNADEEKENEDEDEDEDEPPAPAAVPTVAFASAAVEAHTQQMKEQKSERMRMKFRCDTLESESSALSAEIEVLQERERERVAAQAEAVRDATLALKKEFDKEKEAILMKMKREMASAEEEAATKGAAEQRERVRTAEASWAALLVAHKASTFAENVAAGCTEELGAAALAKTPLLSPSSANADPAAAAAADGEAASHTRSHALSGATGAAIQAALLMTPATPATATPIEISPTRRKRRASLAMLLSGDTTSSGGGGNDDGLESIETSPAANHPTRRKRRASLAMLLSADTTRTTSSSGGGDNDGGVPPTPPSQSASAGGDATGSSVTAAGISPPPAMPPPPSPPSPIERISASLSPPTSPPPAYDSEDDDYEETTIGEYDDVFESNAGLGGARKQPSVRKKSIRPPLQRAGDAVKAHEALNLDDLEDLDELGDSYTEEVARVVEKKKAKSEHVVNEIVSTERKYVADLAILRDVFVQPIVKRIVSPPEKGAHADDRLAQEVTMLVQRHDQSHGGALLSQFAQIGAMANLNAELLADLDSRIRGKGGLTVSGLSAAFNAFLPFFMMYSTYMNGFARAMDSLEGLIVNKKFAAFCDQRGGSSRLSSLMIKPVQRIPRYRLLLEELRKQSMKERVAAASDPEATLTPRHEAERDDIDAALLKAIETVKKIASKCNAGVADHVRYLCSMPDTMRLALFPRRCSLITRHSLASHAHHTHTRAHTHTLARLPGMK